MRTSWQRCAYLSPTPVSPYPAVINGGSAGQPPWPVEECALQSALKLDFVRLVNDMQAMAAAVPPATGRHPTQDRGPSRAGDGARRRWSRGSAKTSPRDGVRYRPSIRRQMTLSLLLRSSEAAAAPDSVGTRRLRAVCSGGSLPISMTLEARAESESAC